MLADKALIVYVQISQWAGRKMDRRATETIAVAHKTSTAAGNYTKKLLPGSAELERVHLLAGQMRKFFYQETLPWFSDGARIIKGDSYMPFAREFSKRKSEYEKAVRDFLKVYPSLQAHAKNSLGSLYSAEDYPDVTRLESKFQCEVAVMPLPDVGDFRTDIDAPAKRKFVDTMERVQKEAMQDCWNRLHDVVSKAAEKLAKPDAIFKNSLIENVQDICDLLPRLNVTDDPKLEAARVKVETAIAKLSPDSLRDNATERQDAAAKLKEITKSMGAFMGGSK